MGCGGIRKNISGIKAPFPYFGGKGRVAGEVWSRFGDVKVYVEPFAGSAAMLLARPGYDPGRHIETINDADGFVANFWRAMAWDPEAVIYWADWPVNEADLHARHGWLVNRRERLLWSLADPEFYDAKIAGWWVWGMCCWIGSGFCSGAGPWVSDGATIRDSRESAIPGAESRGHQRRLPHLGDAGRGINRISATSVRNVLTPVAERLARVRVCCGDWDRVCKPSVVYPGVLSGVFLDPPYSAEAGYCDSVYAVKSATVAHDVRAWCEANGNNPLLRIALCGYEGEGHEALEALGWTVHAWKAQGGYGHLSNGRGINNRLRERVWFSPHCLPGVEGIPEAPVDVPESPMPAASESPYDIDLFAESE